MEQPFWLFPHPSIRNTPIHRCLTCQPNRKLPVRLHHFSIHVDGPFLWLTGEGRRLIGMRRPEKIHGLLFSVVAGAAACSVMFVVAELCFGNTVNNWFVYISKSYSAVELIRNATGGEKQVYFLIYALVGMTFSPIGEELLYRGMIHDSFAIRLGEHQASLVDSLAFSLTH